MQFQMVQLLDGHLKTNNKVFNKKSGGACLAFFYFKVGFTKPTLTIYDIKKFT